MKFSWRWLLLIMAVALVVWVSYDYYSVVGRFGADARLWNSSVRASVADEIRWAYTQMMQARMRLTGGLVVSAMCVVGFLWLHIQKGRAS